MSVKVSIITPSLNAEKTIRDTIESVLDQTYRNIEYIIVDGKSTDRTVAIIEEYLPLFQGRMRYISERDSGIYNAMNRGIRMSGGKLIGIINSDDFYERNAVEKVVEAMSNEACQMIYGYCRMLDKHGKTMDVNCVGHDNLFQKTFLHPTCFVSRETYCRYGLFNEHYKVAADCDLIYRFYQSHIKFIQVKDILANYRMGGYHTKIDHRRELAWIKFVNGGIGGKAFLSAVLESVLCKQ